MTKYRDRTSCHQPAHVFTDILAAHNICFQEPWWRKVRIFNPSLAPPSQTYTCSSVLVVWKATEYPNCITVPLLGDEGVSSRGCSALKMLKLPTCAETRLQSVPIMKVQEKTAAAWIAIVTLGPGTEATSRLAETATAKGYSVLLHYLIGRELPIRHELSSLRAETLSSENAELPLLLLVH